jgi:hypothetical protein
MLLIEFHEILFFADGLFSDHRSGTSAHDPLYRFVGRLSSSVAVVVVSPEQSVKGIDVSASGMQAERAGLLGMGPTSRQHGGVIWHGLRYEAVQLGGSGRGRRLGRSGAVVEWDVDIRWRRS